MKLFKKKKKPYKLEKRYIPELGREMAYCKRRGTVRLQGNGPLCEVGTIKWLEDGAKRLGKPLGEFLDAIAKANPQIGTEKPKQPIQMFHEDDDFVPREP